jgi:hypothetical protein
MVDYSPFISTKQGGACSAAVASRGISAFDKGIFPFILSLDSSDLRKSSSTEMLAS